MPDPLPVRGRIDLHSHLLPGIDDGCQNLDQSLDCVRQLMARGYVGTVCTPHIWGPLFPHNTPASIARHVRGLQRQIHAAGLDYTLWPGGEVRLCDEAIAWLGEHGVPTLADSRLVLCDFWCDQWPRFVDRTFDWLIAEGYTPVLAHPERLGCVDELFDRLDSLADRGILLQGNFKPLTGDEGPRNAAVGRRLLDEDRYDLMALDMHDPESLPPRFAGLELVARDYGQDRLQHLIETAPRERVLGVRLHAAA